MQKKIILFIILIISIFTCANGYSSGGNSVAKVQARNSLEREGKILAEQGLYDQSLAKYREAIQPAYISKEHQKATAIGSIINILKVQGKYEEALNEQLWFLRHAKPTPVAFEDEKEIKSLIEFQKTGDTRNVYKHVSFLMEKYESSIPPTGYGLYSSIVITNILLLYDTIGDYDAGIAFIDEILAYFRTGKAGDPKPGRVDAEYMKVREAFEQDKKEGTKGRATKALIQSDYFPW